MTRHPADGAARPGETGSAWRADSLVTFGHLATIVVSGLLPTTAAWLTKLLLDDLTSSGQGHRALHAPLDRLRLAQQSGAMAPEQTLDSALRGTHAELTALDGHYARLFRMQASGYNSDVEYTGRAGYQGYQEAETGDGTAVAAMVPDVRTDLGSAAASRAAAR